MVVQLLPSWEGLLVSCWQAKHRSFFPEAKFMILPACLNSLSPSGVHPTLSFQTQNKTLALVCLDLSQVGEFKSWYFKNNFLLL